MSHLDLFIRDLDERKGKIPCCQEVTDIQTSVENVLKSLLLEVKKVHPFLKSTLINSGSFYEGTKVGKPDEFDYFVQLDNFSEPADIRFDELPRSTVIVIPSESGFRKLPKRLRWGFDWKESVKAPFVKTLNIKAKGFEAYGMKVLRAVKRHGPAYCLELEWTGGERYRGLKISVDLSLAVKINCRSSTLDVDLETPAGKVIKTCLDSLPYFFAISGYNHLFDGRPETPSELFTEYKASALDGSVTELSVDNVCLRCSQSCLEQALFRHFGSDGGPTVCLRVLKVLRDMMLPFIERERFVFDNVNIVMDHWRFLAEFLSDKSEADQSIIRAWMRHANNKTGCYIDQFDDSKWISSYALKTLVLFEWKQNPADEQWAGSNLSERLLNILRNLRLSANDMLSSFFYRDYEIFPSVYVGFFYNTAFIGRITILLSLLLSIRDGRKEYNFEECLENVVEGLKWICQKVKLYNFLLAALLDLFSHDLDKVISSKSLNKDKRKEHFCSVYIQALLDKIAVEVKLILPEPETLSETVSVKERIELFTEIASKRMKGLVNLPSFSFSLQPFEAYELAKLLKFLCIIFREDIEILLINFQ